jgi:hypothetical protein
MFNITKASLVCVALVTFATSGHAETYTYRLTEVVKGSGFALNKSGHVTGDRSQRSKSPFRFFRPAILSLYEAKASTSIIRI